MYPVQMMISYFTTSFTAIMHIGREVTAKQYTGGNLQDSKGTYIKKQAQEWVRLVSCRYKEGQCRHILSFLACLHSFVISNYWLPPVCHSVWNDRSMTMFVWNVLFAAKNLPPTRITQRYCGYTCRRYADHHGINDNRVEGPLYAPVIREFTCLRCGKHVRVTDGRDCRTKFCSQHCEKLYWKHSKKVSSVVMHREFTCRECGKVVVVTEPKDRRRSFCSDECRKRWFNQRRSVSYKPR